ncbi:MAG: ABC transporter ATP-binding protein [Planctomycetota bacterium]|nr:MAG: ABC transporter ATP-binding protein [Planctomycetota bacterium]
MAATTTEQGQQQRSSGGLGRGAAPPAPAAHAENLVFAYGHRVALSDVTLSIESGRLHGIVGPNGAGKTTLLKLLAGKLTDYRGSVRIFGHDPRREAAKVRARVGWLPDGPAVYAGMRVVEFLAFCAAAWGVPRRARSGRIERALAETGLDHWADVRIRTLSRGWQRRVGIARLLVTDPDLWLLDEPAAGLDPRARIELMRLLRMQVEQGKTIVFGSHILADVGDHCDRLVVLDRGRCRFQGSVHALIRRYAAEHALRIRLSPVGSSTDIPVEAVAALLRCSGLGGGSVDGTRGDALVVRREASHSFVVSGHWVREHAGDVTALLKALMEAGLRVEAIEELREPLHQVFWRVTSPGVS